MEKRNKKNKERGNGEGTIYYSEALGCYVAQYFDSSGKRKTMKQKKNEKTGDFKRRFNDILSKLNKGTYIAKTDETLLEILEHHIQQKFDDGITRGVSYKRELETLEQIKKCCDNFINKSIQKINVEDIEKSKIKIREYSKNCIDKIWRLLNKGFKIAYSRRKINYNIMEDETLTKPISKKSVIPVQALSVTEENSLINILNSNRNIQYKNIVLLQLYTGARIGEILSLTKSDINLKENTLTINKTLTKDENGKIILGEHTKTYDKKTGIDKGKRTFPMTLKVRNIINEILSNKITNIHNLLFWDYRQDYFIKPYEINSFLYRINKSNNICSFSLSTHNLRHTFITRCQEKGMPLVVIQSLVGHVEGSSITNDIYTSVSLDFMKQELNKIK